MRPSHIRLGNHVESAGNKMSNSRITSSTNTNKITPRKATAVDTPVTPEATNTFNPTGGVTRPITTVFVTITPNQMGSKPKEVIKGNVNGNVRIKMAI